MRLAVRLYGDGGRPTHQGLSSRGDALDPDVIVEMLAAVLAGALRAAQVADPELRVESVLEEVESR
ncbi:hypothetical protein [Amycolatopsis sp. EV170708-02-1]|uniref:hypothetical protein n=1 Tax=Amycolatopsis sp. EV170708-02-1 TaxID=2919322 RepID=UPI001F0B9FB1|nr:hypothetical protein [Amycolatopsis sp. EV170708-02-1]UMP00034.1 hypothetical protein MJQ72_26390 [Amycolatopsis sp. EV170708-02-1]